jgi:hypothetical protein
MRTANDSPRTADAIARNRSGNGEIFQATSIPASKSNAPFAFLSRHQRKRTLSSASQDAAGSQVITSSYPESNLKVTDTFL